MQKHDTLGRRLRLPLLSLLWIAASCQSSLSKPPSAPKSITTTTAPAASTQATKAEIRNDFTATAQVVAVAQAERMLTLRREDGTQYEVAVPDDVRNFGEIAAGDTLRLRYEERLAAEVVPDGALDTAPKAAFAAARAKPGEKPGAGLGWALDLCVRIESIDLEHGIVVFAPASGELLARRLQTPQGREFVQGLEVGDVVRLAYVEVLALEIQKL